MSLSKVTNHGVGTRVLRIQILRVGGRKNRKKDGDDNSSHFIIDFVTSLLVLITGARLVSARGRALYRPTCRFWSWDAQKRPKLTGRFFLFHFCLDLKTFKSNNVQN
jgi:hypothetical protein